MNLGFLRLAIIAMLLFLAGTSSKATHVMGSDLAYECLGNGKYRIIVNLYRDCNGNPLLSTASYQYRCVVGSGLTNRTAIRVSQTDVTGIESACGVISKCQSGSNFGYGIEQHVYVDTVDFSSLSCCQVKVSYSICCRNSDISTGSADQNFYTEMVIDKCVSSCNSSPKYTNFPVAIVCRNQDVILNSGAVDTIDVGDSLSYELTSSLLNATNSVTYIGQFNPYRPLTFSGFPNANLNLPDGFHLDPVTGDLAFRPTVLNQLSVIAFKVKEWRKDSVGTWQLVGETRRDLQVIVINCVNQQGVSNTLPALASQPTSLVCSGDSVCMKITVSDANSADTVRLSWNNGIPGAKFSIANPGGQLDTAYVCWRPDVRDTSSVPYSFTITAKDNACPFPGSTTRAYGIQVGLKPETQMFFDVDTCGLIEMRSVPFTTYIDPIYTWRLTDTSQDTVYYSASYNKNAYAFLDPGKYYVYHKIETNFQCFSEFLDSFEIDPYPVVRGNLPNDTFVCKYSPISLNSVVSGGVAPLKYSWNTSPQDTTTTLSLNVDYDTMLVITVSDKFGCFHRDTVLANVWDLPESRIAVDQNHNCFTNNGFTFYDSSTISTGTLSRSWDFGDTDTSDQAVYLKSYTISDTFLVRLISTSNHGCLDTAYDSVWVHPQATPIISVNDSAQCFRGNSYQFNGGLSTIPYESITEYFWDFGDTSSATSGSVAKKYNRFGDMLVRLITKTESGCLDTAWKQVRVNPQANLAIQVSDSAHCLTENLLSFDANNSSIDDGFISYLHWSWGDALADTGWMPPSHNYAVSDTFTVRLLSQSDQGCQDSIYQKIVIHPQTQISFSIDSAQYCLKANLFRVDAAASTLSSGTIQQYSWDFGDGDTISGIQSQHTYTYHDTFSIQLITTTALQCRDTLSKRVIVHPQASLNFISFMDSQCLNINNYDFDASSSSIDWGTIDSLYWDFGDGAKDTGWNIPSHSYTAVGPYNVMLRSVSYFGCADTVSQTRLVHPRAIPAIQFNYPDHCLSDNLFDFNANGSTGIITDYLWTLEDGTSLFGVNPAPHSFTTADSFDIRLITRTNFNCYDTLDKELVVHPQPSAILNLNEDEHCLSGNNFTFDATSSTIPSGSISTYHWDYGDGTSDYGSIIPSKVYATDGTYQLKLKTSSALGCSDSASKTITIHPQMIPAISIVDSFACVRGNYFQLNANNSTIPTGTIQSYQWDFGDGNTQSGVNVGIKNFAYYDTFDIRLRTISDYGCSDSIFRKIVVYPQPEASFVINDSIQCFDQYMSFDYDASSSSVPSPWAGIVSYDWKSSDGTQYNGVNWLNKSYSGRAIYTTQLKVRSNDGCLDSTEKQVLFYPAMNPVFSTPDSAQCFNEHGFVFDASASTIPLGTITTYNWKYGDVTQDLGVISANKRFATFDTFGVWLVTTSNEGCQDSVYGEVIVFESPLAAFNVPETCLKQASIFTDESVLVHDKFISWKWDFGDGNTDTLQSPIHYYKRADYFDVKLEVESENNCFDDTLVSSAAWVKELPKANFDFERTDFDYRTVEMQFNNLSVNAINYDWSFGDGRTSQQKDPIVTYKDTLHYPVVLIVMNSLGCFDTMNKIVFSVPEYLIHVPNAFTPNQDAHNETFGPDASEYYQKYSMTIMNRWGEIIFSTDQLTNRWDGTYKGEACPMDMYFYHIKVIDVFGELHNLRGSVLLYR